MPNFSAAKFKNSVELLFPPLIISKAVIEASIKQQCTDDRKVMSYHNCDSFPNLYDVKIWAKTFERDCNTRVLVIVLAGTRVLVC